MLETLIGGLLGGLFRLIPEALKFFDKKNERKHELDMFDKQLAVDKARSDQDLAKINAQGKILLDQAGLSALVESIKGQAQQLVDAGSAWINATNIAIMLVRPIVAYSLVGLYATVKIATAIVMYHNGASALDAVNGMYTNDDRAILAGVLNFYFLNRVFEKGK